MNTLAIVLALSVSVAKPMVENEAWWVAREFCDTHDELCYPAANRNDRDGWDYTFIVCADPDEMGLPENPELFSLGDIVRYIGYDETSYDIVGANWGMCKKLRR